MLQCDLLIIDDLGTEFSTSFVTAAIYNIVNTRLMTHKPTIISTNLSMKELEERYTERFASRILGSYIPLFSVVKISGNRKDVKINAGSPNRLPVFTSKKKGITYLHPHEIGNSFLLNCCSLFCQVHNFRNPH